MLRRTSKCQLTLNCADSMDWMWWRKHLPPQSMSFGPQPLSCGSRGFVLSRICPSWHVCFWWQHLCYRFQIYLLSLDEGTAFLWPEPDVPMGEKKAFANSQCCSRRRMGDLVSAHSNCIRNLIVILIFIYKLKSSILYFYKKQSTMLGMVSHTYNPSIKKANATIPPHIWGSPGRCSKSQVRKESIMRSFLKQTNRI